MPYKKGGEAYKRSLERKKAKRRIARLEKEIGKSNSDKERLFYRQQIDSLREQMTRTYEINPLTHKATGFTKDELKMSVMNLSRMNVRSEMGRSGQVRKNFITQQELNRAESYYMIGPRLGEFSKEEVQIFYRATQKAWEGLSPDKNRNKAILDYYGKSDLREFVREVLAMNEKAVKSALEERGFVLYNEEGLAKDIEADRDGSADFLADVVSPEMYDALQSYVKEPETDVLEIPSFE